MSDPTHAVATPKTNEELVVILSELKKGNDIDGVNNEDMEQLASDPKNGVTKLTSSNFTISNNYYYICKDGTMIELNCQQDKPQSLFEKKKEDHCIIDDPRKERKDQTKLIEIEKMFKHNENDDGEAGTITTDNFNGDVWEVKKENKSSFKLPWSTGGRKSRRSITIPNVITKNSKKITGSLQTGVDTIGRGLSGFVGIGKSIERVAQKGVDGVSKGIKKTVGGRRSRKSRKSRKTRR